MFDHRIPLPSKSRRGVVAVLLCAALGCVYGGVRLMGRPSAASAAVPSTVANSNIIVKPTAARAPRNDSISKLAILVFKSEKRMEVWGWRMERWSLLREYPVLAASGVAGPKLAEGDRQVPEGVYRVVEMNPRSRFHMSVKLDYPNAFDRSMAEREGRFKLGNDICIHGKNCSVGCVAIGDPAVEVLFALLERTGQVNAKVIIAPNDLREHIAVKNPNLKKITWLNELYDSLVAELKPFKRNS